MVFVNKHNFRSNHILENNCMLVIFVSFPWIAIFICSPSQFCLSKLHNVLAIVLAWSCLSVDNDNTITSSSKWPILETIFNTEKMISGDKLGDARLWISWLNTSNDAKAYSWVWAKNYFLQNFMNFLGIFFLNEHRTFAS